MKCPVCGNEDIKELTGKPDKALCLKCNTEFSYTEKVLYVKKEISIQKSDLYLTKLFFLILSAFGIYVSIRFLFIDDKILSGIIIGIINLYIIRFLWFTRHISIDKSSLCISGLFNQKRLPLNSIIAVENTFAMMLQRYRQIKITFKESNNRKKVVLFVPKAKAFKTKDIVGELRNLIDNRKKISQAFDDKKI